MVSISCQPASFTRIERTVSQSQAIGLVPIGEAKSQVLKRLEASLSKIFGREVKVLKTLPCPSYTYDSKRDQYRSYDILNYIKDKEFEGCEKVLGIVDVDLYVPGLNFVFGTADVGGKAALISLLRLRQEFYGLEAQKDLFLERVVKEGVHELGHSYSLKHCANPKCVMYFSNSLADTDRKGSNFCEVCRKKLLTQKY